MYDSYMASNTYPLAMPPELMAQVRQAAEQTHLSLADAMRQSMKLGLPKLVESLSPSPLAGLKPMTEEECERCWGKGSEQDPFNAEFDSLAAHIGRLPVPLPEDE